MRAKESAVFNENTNALTIGKIIDWIFPVALFIAVLGMAVPFSPEMPGAGLDPSWRSGLNQAVEQGFVMGRDIIFTFGPYASIYTTTVHPATIKIMYFGSVYIALAIFMSLYVMCDKNKLANIFLIFSLCIIPGIKDAFLFFSSLTFGLFFIFDKKEKISKSTNIIISILACSSLGFIILIKGSCIPLVAGVVVLCSMVLIYEKKWVELICLTIGTPLSSFLLWIIAGQPADEFIYFFFSILPIISGYTESMALWGRYSELLIYSIGSLLILYSVFYGTQKIYKRVLTTLIFAMILFLAFKAGFVRHDGHALIAAKTILLSCAIACVLYCNGRKFIISSFSILIVFFMISLNYIGINNIFTLDPFYSSYYGIKTLVFNNEDLYKNYNNHIQNIKNKSNLPKLEGTVDIYSYDQSDLIASGNVWNPRPIFQSYSAYTKSLAEKNKQHLLKVNAPDHIIFKIQPIDNRLASLEDGASWPIILSKYKPIGYKDDYLILKNKQNYDYKFKTISKVSSCLGDVISVPKAKGIIFAKVSIKLTSLGKLMKLFFKPSLLYINLHLADKNKVKKRFIADMGQSEFLISPFISNTEEFLMLYTEKRFYKNNEVEAFSITPKKWDFLWAQEYSVEFIEVSYRHEPSSINLLEISSPGIVQGNIDVHSIETCSGSIDHVNGRQVTRPIVLEDIIKAGGWLAKSIEEDIPVENVLLILTDDEGNIFTIKTKMIDRPDVAKHFGKKDLARSGFHGKADVSKLSGKYTLRLGFMEGNTLHVCSNFNVPLVINPQK